MSQSKYFQLKFPKVYYVFILFVFFLEIPLIQSSSISLEKPYLSGGYEETIHEKAKQFLEKGEVEKAIKVYDETLTEYKPTEYCVMFVIDNKIKIYRERKMYDKAEQTLLSLRDMPITPNTLYGPDLTPYNIEREFHIALTLANWYEESGNYEKALEKSKEAIEWHLKLVNATDYELQAKRALEPFNPESHKALALLQMGPAILGDIYFKWGKYDLARQKYLEQIDFLSANSTRSMIFDKLEPENRLAWQETNPKVILPLEIAKCYEKEGKYIEALHYTEQVKKALEDPALKQRYEQFPIQKFQIEIIRDRDLAPLSTRCKEKIK